MCSSCCHDMWHVTNIIMISEQWPWIDLFKWLICSRALRAGDLFVSATIWILSLIIYLTWLKCCMGTLRGGGGSQHPPPRPDLHERDTSNDPPPNRAHKGIQYGIFQRENLSWKTCQLSLKKDCCCSMPVASDLLLQHLLLANPASASMDANSFLKSASSASCTCFNLTTQRRMGKHSITWRERMAQKGFLTWKRSSAQCRRCRCLWMLSSWLGWQVQADGRTFLSFCLSRSDPIFGVMGNLYPCSSETSSSSALTEINRSVETTWMWTVRLAHARLRKTVLNSC